MDTYIESGTSLCRLNETSVSGSSWYSWPGRTLHSDHSATVDSSANDKDEGFGRPCGEPKDARILPQGEIDRSPWTRRIQKFKKVQEGWANRFAGGQAHGSATLRLNQAMPTEPKGEESRRRGNALGNATVDTSSSRRMLDLSAGFFSTLDRDPSSPESFCHRSPRFRHRPRTLPAERLSSDLEIDASGRWEEERAGSPAGEGTKDEACSVKREKTKVGLRGVKGDTDEGERYALREDRRVAAFEVATGNSSEVVEENGAKGEGQGR
ncbi:hypothetical protein KM043_002957 [Ampulex compressa]|nr:hypothetical protein KM043_002957 [Ampulex compressa]